MLKLFDFYINLFGDGEGSEGGESQAAESPEQSNESQKPQNQAEKGVANQEEEEKFQFFDKVVESNEEEGEENQPDVDAEKASFEDLIKKEYKEDYEAKLQEHLSRRLKNYKQKESKLDLYEPIIDYIKDYTGMDNIEEAFEKLQSETLEEIAISKGYPSVEAYKEVRELKNTIKNINKTAAPEAQSYNAEYVRQQMIEQEAAMRDEFPGFKVIDYLPPMDSEGRILDNPSKESSRFLENLKNGMQVRTAYIDAYYDKIIKEAKQSAIKNTTNNIKKRSSRPSELAASGGSPVYKLNKDISAMSDAEFIAFKKEKKRLAEKGIDILRS